MDISQSLSISIGTLELNEKSGNLKFVPNHLKTKKNV